MNMIFRNLNIIAVPAVFFIFSVMPAVFAQSQAITDNAASRVSVYIEAGTVKETELIKKDFMRLLEKKLAAHDYRLVESQQSELSKRLSDKNDQAFHVDVQIDRSEFTENLEFYVQIYNPQKNRLIDAFNITDHIYMTPGLNLDPQSLREPDSERISKAARRIPVRLRSNPKRRERRQNIDRFVISTRLTDYRPQMKEFIKEAESGEGAEEVFEILKQQTRITVASNVVTEVEKQPASVTVITREMIGYSGARSLNELLSIFVPGYFMVEDQDDVIAGFRGLAPDNNSKVLMLLNGHNINTEYFWGPPDAVMQGIDLGFIERIEIIRGPGSVTLGQGALLGVINIITRDASSAPRFSTIIGVGRDNYLRTTLMGSAAGNYMPELSVFSYASRISYNGQKLRRDSYAIYKEYEGSELTVDDPVVADTGQRLNRREQMTFMTDIRYRQLRVGMFHTDQKRDSYLFYRDRSKFRNRLSSVNGSYKYTISRKVSVKSELSFANDDIILYSPRDVINGGTREQRYSVSVIANLNDVISDNNLALGLESRYYKMGMQNYLGHNFIINQSKNRFGYGGNAADTPTDFNSEFAYVYPYRITVYSLFAENFYSVTPDLDIFAAFRFDQHTGWGSNISPRLGTLYAVSADLRFRLSYHEGFRGAPGVAYSGGFQKDGHLRAENFDKVSAVEIPQESGGTYQNIAERIPEKIRSVELAGNYRYGRHWSFDLVSFYNIVQNVLDVGVIFADADKFTLPSIGSDEPGTWNGYWFYKNNNGDIHQAGGELQATYQSRIMNITASHSLVQLVSAPEEQLGSVYVTPNRKPRAYPQNVSRLYLFYYLPENSKLHLNYQYYYDWVSPEGNVLDAAHIINTGISYRFKPELKAGFYVKNLAGADSPYPMNANAGDRDASDGAPSIPGTTFWFELRYEIE